jgi:hypothetical protein
VLSELPTTTHDVNDDDDDYSDRWRWRPDRRRWREPDRWRKRIGNAAAYNEVVRGVGVVGVGSGILVGFLRRVGIGGIGGHGEDGGAVDLFGGRAAVHRS